MSLGPIISELQKTNPSAIIELFELKLDPALHGDQSVMTYRFHAGSNLDLNGKVIWQTKDYLRYPVEASGFAFQKGQLPRPEISISNALSLISAIMLQVNGDLTGAKVTRIRTLAKFLDSDNFPDGNADAANHEFPREVYYIDRKVLENREIVTYELASITDLAGMRLPKRQCTRDLFPSIGTFV